jgi:alkylation response protein AidB-like acyl-CoA dehydrogenase
MELVLTEPQARLRARARQVAAEHVAPRAESADAESRFPEAQVRALADAGLLTMLVPESAGGTGHGSFAYALAVAEVAEACASTAVTMAVTNMVADAVHAWGRPDQHERVIPALGSGRWLAGAFALSEPGAGSDASSLKAVADRVERGYRLRGSKCWITSGDQAGVVLVMAKTDSKARSRGISAFVVELPAEGVEVGRHEEKMGLRASSTVSLTLEDVEVPTSARLGDEGVGFQIAMRALDGGRIGVASQALGIGRAALQEARQLLPAGSGGLDRWEADLRTAQLLILRAATLKDLGRPFTREASMAKLYATEAANRVALEAYRAVAQATAAPSARLERAVRDVRVTTIYEGTSEIQRLVIARKVLQEGVAPP